MTDPNARIVPVEISNLGDVVKNFADVIAKPRFVRHTTFNTIILDSTDALFRKMAQICDYEPSRIRMVIRTLDQPIAILTEIPHVSPDTSSVTVPPAGLHLPTVATAPLNEFFGPDAMWANTLVAGTTRVTILKEYC